MLIRIALVSLIAGCVWGAQNPAIAIAGGVCYRYDDGARQATDEDGSFSWSDDYGTHFVLGASAPEKAFIGYPWLDFDWSRSTGNGNRIDSLGILYIERIPLGNTIYLGLGPGSFYNNIRIQRDGYIERDHKWRLGGRALLGANLPAGLYLEAGYNYSGSVAGLKTDSADLSLGIRF